MATQVARNANETIVTFMMGSDSLCLAGIWSLAVGFVLVLMAGIWL